MMHSHPRSSPSSLPLLPRNGGKEKICDSHLYHGRNGKSYASSSSNSATSGLQRRDISGRVSIINNHRPTTKTQDLYQPSLSMSRAEAVQQTDARHVSNDHYNSGATAPAAPTALYASMSRLAPSEPIYLDLERDLAAEAALRETQTASNILNNSTLPERPSAYETARVRFMKKNELPFQGTKYVYHTSKRSSKPRLLAGSFLHPPTEPTPIVFQDPIELGSVATGLSQQELIRKKARRDSKNKREKKAARSKKKEGRILNMPMSLLIGKKNGNSHSHRISNHIGEIKIQGKVPVSLTDSGLQFAIRHTLTHLFSLLCLHPQSTNSRVGELGYTNPKQPGVSRAAPSPVADDMDGSTASTTNTGSAESAQKYDMPYSAVPAQSGVLNEADGAQLLEEWALRHSPSTDARSVVSEDSFPILSKFGGHLSVTESMMPDIDEEEEYAKEGDIALRDLTTRNTASPQQQSESLGERRGVRFSQTLEASTHVYDGERSEAPWDERADDSSPTSVVDDLVGATPFGYCYDSSPEEKVIIVPEAQNSMGKPKSILRRARFTPTYNEAPYTDSRGRSQFGTGDAQHSSPLNAMTAPIVVKSPPRPGAFFNEEGTEVSPITKPPKTSIESNLQKVKLQPKPEFAHAAAFRKIVEKANGLYPDPPLTEESSLYSDPPLELPLEDQVSIDGISNGF